MHTTSDVLFTVKVLQGTRKESLESSKLSKKNRIGNRDPAVPNHFVSFFFLSRRRRSLARKTILLFFNDSIAACKTAKIERRPSQSKRR